MTTNLYEFIKKRCEALGMTMSQLQDKTGLSWGIISGIKNGKGIRAGTKQKLAEALLCSIGDIQAALSLDAAGAQKKDKKEAKGEMEEKQPAVMEVVDMLDQLVKEEYPEEVPEEIKADLEEKPEKRPKITKLPKLVTRDPDFGEATAVNQPVTLQAVELKGEIVKSNAGIQWYPDKPKKEPEGTDNVNHPAHYTQGSIECIAAIEASMTEEEFRGYLKGCQIKYLWRYRLKGGVEDLKKSRWYLDRLIRRLEENHDKSR